MDDARYGMGTGLLVSELAEVYLLLDNVSSVASKPVPDLNDDPLFKNAAGVSWIEQICEIRWPPDPAQPQNEALNAARLIRAKDRLNAAAQPASGASIAFTKMMSGDSVEAVPRKRRWWNLGWTSTESTSDSAPTQPGPAPSLDRLNDGGSGPRKCLASYAFPELYRRAAVYRAIYYALHTFMVAALIGTCLMSWTLTTGSSLLNNVTRIDVVAAVADTKPPPQIPATATDQSGVTVSKTAGSPAASASGTVANLQNREIATQNLMRWVDDNRWLAWVVGGYHQHLSYSTSGGGKVEVPNVAWAAVLIGVLTGTILPILYGLLGASAAVVRSMASRISANTLMPRDLVLGLVQLGLGAVIGACVSLFISEDGNSATSGTGLLGPVRLSTSALCFLAGFGVEGVFRALEGFVTRVFPPAAPVVAAPAPLPIHVTVQAPTPPDDRG